MTLAVPHAQDPAPPTSEAGLTYACQPRLGGSATRLTLKDDVLTYQVGFREGQIALKDVAGVRLLFHPAKFAHSSYEMRLRGWRGERFKVGSVSRVSLTGVRDQGPDYAVFVRALHDRLAVLAKSGAILGDPQVDFRGGFSRLRWWVMAVLGFLALAGMVAVLGFALIDRQWGFAGFLAVLSAFVAHPTVEMIVRNRPVRYRPEAPPARLLPH